MAATHKMVQASRALLLKQGGVLTDLLQDAFTTQDVVWSSTHALICNPFCTSVALKT